MRGKFSILHNLPHPKVRLVAGHGYISIVEIVKDLLGSGTEVSSITENSHLFDGNVRSVNECLRAQQILQRAKVRYPGKDVLALAITEWSDDFDPSYSTKKTKGSVWIKTVTIGLPHSNALSHTTMQNTYPIACGHNSANHEEVEKMFATELAELSSSSSRQFYYAKENQMRHVYAEVLVSL